MSQGVPLARIWRGLSLAGLLGLILWVIIWNVFLSKKQIMPVFIELALMLIPLALLWRGIWHNQGKSHVFAILLSLIYATLGLWFLMAPQEERYGLGLLLFSMCLYGGSFMAARVIAHYNKQQAGKE